MKVKNFFIILLVLSTSILSRAQTNGQPNIYKSPADDALTIDTISYVPFSDNLQGIYARPLETYLASLMNQSHRWNFIPPPEKQQAMSPADVKENADQIKNVGHTLGADGFFMAQISKGPNGITMSLSLFTSVDGLLLAQAELDNYQHFDIKHLKAQFDTLLNQILRKIPYSGRVLSRQGNRVTVNVGTQDGVKNGQTLSVIQIIKTTRHPKFHFIVSTEKGLLGKIKITKADDTLSFGVITLERDLGAIQKGSKLDSLNYITYGEPPGSSAGVVSALEHGKDGKVVFGPGAHEWRPMDAPSFGQVGARFGLSRFDRAMNLDGVGGLNAHNDFSPVVFLDGELWLTPQWTLHAQIREGILSINNPRSGSQPSDLSESLTYYELLAGYRFRFGPSAWSAYVEPFFGYMTYKLFVDDAHPQAYPTTEYDSLKIGLRGEFPLTEDGVWNFGGHLALALAPRLRETPVTSGSSKNTINQFGVEVNKRLGAHLKLEFNLDFELYSSSFSGAGSRDEAATTASQRYMTLSSGLAYMF